MTKYMHKCQWLSKLDNWGGGGGGFAIFTYSYSNTIKQGPQKNDNWGWGAIFISSCSALLIEFF